ncbi:MAG: MMPL family transporter [Myxococcaceae bacterium]
MSDKSAFITRAITAYANLLVKHPGRVLLVLLSLGVGSGWLASKLTIESDQLSLISQDLPEVKEVKRVIDMVGGAGYLQLALRSTDEKALKKLADSIHDTLTEAKNEKGEPWVRFMTYKIPIEFVQENMVLFIRTEDLVEGKKRINAYLKDQLRRNNPFYIELRKTEPVKLDLTDLVNKYSAIGKKSIRDDYYISDDKQMMMILIKPMWNSTMLGNTQDFIAAMTGKTAAGTVLTQGLLADAAKKAGVQLVEDYDLMGDGQKVAFGFTGSYKTNVDDSVAIVDSLDDITISSLVLIALVIAIFFRRFWPTLIVLSGIVLGTIMTLGFAKLTLGELNMVTSIIAAILLGFGIDYGIHFTYRARIEFGTGKPWDDAIRQAFINAGRPALISAIVTAGSFFVLLVSEFRGFSQFGFLAGFGTMITALTLFSWAPAVLALAGHRNPAWPEKLTGRMTPPSADMESGKTKLPNPKLLLAGSLAVVALVCSFAVPWTDFPIPKDREMTMWERFKGGVRFNYNTRALMPVDQPSVKLQDEINRRFKISSDPIAVYTKDVEGAKDIWDSMTDDPDHNYNVDTSKYPTVDQVVSIFTFTPPPKTAEANAKVLAEWREELKDIDVASLPPEMQDKAAFFMKVLEKKPFDVYGVPEVYASQFRHLPTTKPENHGYLTFLYPKVDLWDGKNLLTFADQTRTIKGKSGAEYPSAGLAILYAKLARIVLWDGKITVLLAALWILIMHYLDFRSVTLALASVVPLGIGLLMMLGMLSITNHRLNFMNLVILPILLGFGVSHGLYLLHRFLEGTSPLVALRSVGGAVASSTLTAIAGFASLGFAQHLGLRSIGYVACLGLGTTLLVSFTVLASILQIIYDRQGAQKLGETKS